MKQRAGAWGVIIIFVLMACSITGLFRHLPSQPGIDFSQPWGFGKAQRASNYQLGSPYLNLDGYQNELLQIANDSNDERLATAILNRQQPDPTGTPLMYYMMGNLPGSFATDLQVYRVVQVAAFLIAAFVLAWPVLKGVSGALFPIALAAAYVPLLFDLAVGNFDCFQLLAFVLAAASIDRLRKTGLSAIHSAALACILVLLSLFKPNFDSATALLWLCLLANAKGHRITILVASAAATAVLVVLPCLLFNSWSIWSDWHHYALPNANRIAYPVGAGNHAAVALLSQRFGLSIVLSMLVCGLLLSSAPAWLWVRHELAFMRVLLDPYACLSIGIVAAFALSPLIWQHYHVLAVAPALWLCRWGLQGLGITTLVLFADLPSILATNRVPVPLWLIQLNHSFCWLVLLLGIALALAMQTPRLRKEKA